jgi:uncharacterized coiled-coil DUF342 family protein
MTTKLFDLKPCEECNGTGDAHHQGHDYDCPDCLGTGYEEPAKKIMNLELMLNQHKETLKSSDAHNNELAQKFEIALQQRDVASQCHKRITEELTAVTAQRDRLIKSVEPLKYWRDISECDCSNPLPQGGCLRCDLNRILKTTNPNEL